jgi:hypothetical protein
VYIFLSILKLLMMKIINFIMGKEFIYVLLAPLPLPADEAPLPADEAPLPAVEVPLLTVEGLDLGATCLSLGAASCLGFLTGFQSSARGSVAVAVAVVAVCSEPL